MNISKYAARLGISVEEYEAHEAAGERWCSGCCVWHKVGRFNAKANGQGGLQRACRDAVRKGRKPAIKKVNAAPAKFSRWAKRDRT